MSTDFAKLSPAEQTAAAERLLKVIESGWRPFWCALAHCDGMPHVVLDDDGEEMWVGHTDTQGPNGEPVSEIIYERRSPEGSEWFLSSAHEVPLATDTPAGRLVYEPGWAHNHAREDQRLLPWKERWILFVASGRGAGKTRMAIEFVTLNARKGLAGAIVGRRGNELVNTHVAEIMKFAHPEFKPEHLASKDILVWPNGALTYLFSAERPENIRSVNLSYCLFDEAAWMDEIESAWDNAKFATRVKSAGNPIHFLITSTPTGTPWVREMEDDEDVTFRRVSTYANKANLDPDFLADLRKRYEGTRKGRQEIYGEVLRDVEGALWNDEIIRHLSLVDKPAEFAMLLDDMDDIVVAVDPAGSKGKRSDATGIIAVGVEHNDEQGDPLPVSRYSVLADGTLKGSPSEWAERTFKVARMVRATRIIAEKNYGGEMVLQTLKDWAKLHPEESSNQFGESFKIELVHAAESKETRAEPTVGKYEQGLIRHVASDLKIGKDAIGDLSALEKEMVTWVPKSRGGRLPSPNRIDACLAEGTMILMGDGSEKPIEQVVIGDAVMTRKGPRRVLRAWVSRENALVMGRVAGNRRGLWATPDHKVWTDTPDEWVNMGSDASVWGKILTWNTQTQQPNLSTWTGWASVGSATSAAKDSALTASITQRLPRRTGLMAGGQLNSTARSTYGRLGTWLRGCTFTTLTSTRSTIIQAIWSRSLRLNTARLTLSTSKPVETGGSLMSSPQQPERSGRIQRLPLGRLGRVRPDGRRSRFSHSPVPSVGLSTAARLNHGEAPTTSVRTHVANAAIASLSRSADATLSSGPLKTANSAEVSSWSTTTRSERGHRDSALGLAVPDTATRIEPRVWDLEVEDEHEFFAEGVLVHNCVWAIRALESVVRYKAKTASQGSVMSKMKRSA